MSPSAYIDLADGTTYPIAEPRWRSDAGRVLEVTDLPGISPAAIDTSVRSLWRYAAAFPWLVADPITMGEGATPLVRAPWGGAQPFFKLEWFNPTGSFKDRGASVMLSYLRDRGVTAVSEDSSGNGGSAVAGYAAAGGLDCTIFAPSSTSPAKIAQVRAYGADIVLVDGPREATTAAAMESAESDGGPFYASHNWQAFFLQGTKTLGYEMWEDLGFQAPDNVIAPVGSGSMLMGCHMAFTELLRAGQIDRLPRLFAAQPANCAPIDAAVTGAPDGPWSPTIAEGTAIPHPVRRDCILQAIRESDGGTCAVPEEEIARATLGLAALGLYAEPTSAQAAAAFTRLVEAGCIDASETTVVILSATGLKASQAIADLS